MSRQTYSVEQIIIKLRQIEVDREDSSGSSAAGGDYGADVLPLAQAIRGHEYRGCEAAEGAGE